MARRKQTRSVPQQGQGRGGITAADADLVRALVIHEDAHMLVFNKPAGLSVQGGSGATKNLEDLLAAFAKSNGKRPRLVHRLDRETSGVIVAARTKPAAAFLSAAFAGREVSKTYLAIVCGGAPGENGGLGEGEIAAALKKSSRQGLDIMEIAREGDSGAQSALTRYRTLAATPAAALIELSPETGRMHQLRVHLASIGRPIAGDGKYGGRDAFLTGTISRKMHLHARRIRVDHPDGGQIDVRADLPPHFADPENLELIGSQSGDDHAWAANAGVLWDVSSRWAVGASFRQGPSFEFATSTVTGPREGSRLIVAQSDNPFRVPDTFSVGVLHRLTNFWHLSFEYDRVNYHQLIDDFRNTALRPGDPESDLVASGVRLDSANQLRFGAEYLWLTPGSRVLAFRGGVWTDPSAQAYFDADPATGLPAPRWAVLLPRRDGTVHLTGGLGFTTRRHFQIDAAVDFSEFVNTLSVSTVWRF